MKKFCVALLALAFAAPTFAAEEKEEKKRDPEAVFKKLDKDGDSKLTLAEFTGKKDAEKAKAAFEKKDSNKDASLTLEEFKAKPKKTK